VLFAYKNFPLTSIHDNAEIAAEAAECANEQGAFWEYHDVLFQNQTALDAASLKGYAATLGLDTDTFNQCLDSGKYKDKVAADSAQMQKLAQEAGLTNYGTPTFFINGHYIGGAYPYDTFKQVIDAALQEAG
jgi:protein-disulfide isomerase